MTDRDFADKLELHKNTVYRLAFSYLKNIQDAEDITQDAFLKLFGCDINFDAPENEKAWLIRVTVNLCKNKLRANKFRFTLPFNEEIITDSSLMDSDLEVLDLLSGLAPKYRAVLYLFYCERYTTQEIARMLGRNENTIRTQLVRGREKLKAMLIDGNDTKVEGGVIYGQQV